MANQSYFMGQDGFSWFVGVVEDRNDPDQLGRVRVRCLGYHTENLSAMPTSDLPWAHVMHPTTDPSMHGMGNTPSWLVEGSWVVGFFRDAMEKQQPVIIGSLPGNPAAAADHRKGFNDPRHEDSTQLNDQGKKQYASNPTYGPYPLDGTTFSRTSGHKIGESDTNRLARNASHAMVSTKDSASTSSVAMAKSTSTWSEPNSSYSAVYPYNHVYETESGHVKEYDDTKDAERIHEYHKAGTFYEIDSAGNKVTRIVGSNYEIVAGTEYVNVKGDVNLTVDSNCRTYIKGNWDIQVDGNIREEIKGEWERIIVGDMHETIYGTLTQSHNIHGHADAGSVAVAAATGSTSSSSANSASNPISNTSTISASVTTTTSTTSNSMLLGPMSVTEDSIWTVEGDGTLVVI